MKNELSKVKLTSRVEDYSQWYLDVAKAWELFEYSPVPGCMIFLPKSVTIWEKIKKIRNEKGFSLRDLGGRVDYTES